MFVYHKQTPLPLLIRPASGRQTGSGHFARMHQWNKLATTTHSGIESPTRSADASLAAAPYGAPHAHNSGLSHDAGQGSVDWAAGARRTSGELRRRVTDSCETVIVGGGIAGLACARRLHDRGRAFRLITEDVGGRIRVSNDGAVNLGAYYVTGDYDHVGHYVDRVRRIRRHRIQCGTHDGSFARFGVPLMTAHLPQTIRFLRLLREFRRHYAVFKCKCENLSQVEALAADPLLQALYHEPASSYLQRHGLADVRRHLLGPASQATAFTSIDSLTAMTMLIGALPAIVPMYEYVFRFDRLTCGFEDAIVLDSVTALGSVSRGQAVMTRRSGTVEADNVVVATPIDVAARFLNLGPVKTPIEGHMFVLRGELRRPWAKPFYTLFPEGHQILAIARQVGGTILLCSSAEHPDFGQYLHSWELVEHHHWNPAFHLQGDLLLPCEQEPRVYLIGDHNVSNLEDAYITGVYAANQIIGSR